MTENLILPPTYLDKIDAPLIFLAGPIQGASDWQKDAIAIIRYFAPTFYVASPRRNIAKKGDFSVEMYNEQVDWETYHLKKAGEKGTVMFWLAKEFKHIRRRAYGQTSRFELGEWKMKHERDGAKLVVGIEEGFSGARYIQKRMLRDCPEVPVCSTLEKTCQEAVRLARIKN